jgi:hypothetical protein
VDCLLKLRLRPFEDEPGKRELQHTVYGLEDAPGGRRFLIEVMSHAHELGALARENECGGIRRMAVPDCLHLLSSPVSNGR